MSVKKKALLVLVLLVPAAAVLMCGCKNEKTGHEPLPTIETAPRHTYKNEGYTGTTVEFYYSTAPYSVQPKMGEEYELFADHDIPSADTAAAAADRGDILPDTQLADKDTAETFSAETVPAETAAETRIIDTETAAPFEYADDLLPETAAVYADG